jgi:hypothetical protein
MLRDTAIAWVRNNCSNPKLLEDFASFVDEAAAKRANCRFIFGSGLTRREAPFLVHSFGNEMFIFQLSEAQAAARGAKPGVLASMRYPHPLEESPNKPILSIERFELQDAVFAQPRPIIGRVHYEMPAGLTGNVCVRLDYLLESGNQTAWDYTRWPLWGKGVLDVKFSPIALKAAFVTDLKGPVVMFVHLVEVTEPVGSPPRRPISNTGAALVDIV